MIYFEGSENDPGIAEVVGEEIELIMEEIGPEMVGTCDGGSTELSLIFSISWIESPKIIWFLFICSKKNL